ncbi:MAG: adenosylcobinamide-GDP ribazoletransferase [Candidatus Puniceispirillales bacterium WSBS_2018_MAG_OTU23]
MTTSPQYILSLYHDIKAAAMILTRIPMRGIPIDAPNFARSYWAFAIIGIGVSAVPALLAAMLITIGAPVLAAVMLALLMVMLMTGGLHYDGLADIADSLGGGDKMSRLNIIHDSQIGSFGTLALVSITIISLACLGKLAGQDPFLMAAGFIAVSGMSRSMMAFQRWMQPTPSDGGLASMTGTPSGQVVIIALMIGLLAGLIFLPIPVVFIVIIMAIGIGLSYIFGLFLTRWIGGVNGDGLGATQQITEAAMLLALTLLI